MNERIKELLEQAGVKYVTMPKDTVYEKFAELIVRECTNWIESQDETEHPTAWLLCDELKQHFGVEE